MTTIEAPAVTDIALGALTVVPLLHPQGCHTYLLADPRSRSAMAIDVHLDFVDEVAALASRRGWSLRYVVDTHTHADHPSGSAALAARGGGERIAHAEARHQGVTRHVADGEQLRLGDIAVVARHAPGHTPDHLVLAVPGAVFAGDTLLIGSVARTDFLGGDAGQLFDSLHRVFDGLPDDTIVFPGHDYQGRVRTTLGAERAGNAWLRLADRADFVQRLRCNPPPRPANMDDLLRLNREGVAIAAALPAAEARRLVEAGGAASVIDVRTGGEFDGEHVPGSRWIALDEVAQRADEVRATPAPRLLLCHVGNRAEMARQALAKLGIGGLSVVTGGIVAYRQAGGDVAIGRGVISIERQVRIGAGSLVLTGVVLGASLHPAFFGLAGFVGAGLVFAGITDWCGMGLLLAKAPWNRGKGARAGGVVAACSAAPPSCAASGCAAPASTPES